MEGSLFVRMESDTSILKLLKYFPDTVSLTIGHAVSKQVKVLREADMDSDYLYSQDGTDLTVLHLITALLPFN